MKKLRIAGLMMFAVCAFSAVTVASASAAEIWQWLADGNVLALGAKLHVELLPEGNTLLLEDMGAVGKPDILCTPAGLGWLLPNGEDELETGACTAAVDDSTSKCTGVTVTALNLPWLSLLVEGAGGVVEDQIRVGAGLNETTEAPGWEVKATCFGLPVTDKCTTNKGKVNVSNTEDGLVFAEFTEVVPVEQQANCTVGGKEQGLVAGSGWLHALSEEVGGEELLTLAVSLAPEEV